MRTRIKICGITSVDGVAATVECGADAVGFVLTESPRQVDLEKARALMAEVPPFVGTVAVLHNPSLAEIAMVNLKLGPDLIQTEPRPDLSGRVARVLPVFHDNDSVSAQVSSYMAEFGPHALHLEGPGRGGRGIPTDPDRAAEVAKRYPVVLAGGLDPENVGTAIRRVRPYAVDVSSGVESQPGRKDVGLLQAFVAAVRAAERGIVDDA